VLQEFYPAYVLSCFFNTQRRKIKGKNDKKKSQFFARGSPGCRY